MIEFETFCYLQNHKTGCSMVEMFLRRHCSEDIVRYEKHMAPKLRKRVTAACTAARGGLEGNGKDSISEIPNDNIYRSINIFKISKKKLNQQKH